MSYPDSGHHPGPLLAPAAGAYVPELGRNGPAAVGGQVAQRPELGVARRGSLGLLVRGDPGVENDGHTREGEKSCFRGAIHPHRSRGRTGGKGQNFVRGRWVMHSPSLTSTYLSNRVGFPALGNQCYNQANFTSSITNSSKTMTAPWSRGSEWHRWDPHIHTPGTALNDHFAGDWDGYLKAIETAAPAAEALGITDYCTIEGYKAFKAHLAKGRAANVRFVFPNVEFRLEGA